MKILLIEADVSVITAFNHSLSAYRYVIDTVTDGETGWIYATTFEYDLIVLDVCLPKLDGLSFCHRFRAEGYLAPILLLTAKGTSSDKVKGLDAGADDYVLKPFDSDELSARIRALLRRSSASPFPQMAWGDLVLNSSTCEVSYCDRPLTLTTKEYELLELFLRDCHCVYSAEEILDRLWSSEEFPAEATVRSHLRRLRKKLFDAGAPPDFIATLHGRGYYLKAPLEESQKLTLSTPIDVSAQPPDPSAPLLLIIDRDEAAGRSGAAAAVGVGLRAEVASTLESARAWLQPDFNRTQQPDAVLLKLSPAVLPHPEADPFDFNFLQELAGTYFEIPILVMQTAFDLYSRLEILQCGGTFLLDASLSADAVISAVQQCINSTRKGAKVMVLDPDQDLLRTLPNVLNPWGFKVSTLASPEQFWSVLEAVSPDALVMEVKLPQINGLELCQILRSELKWRQIPILFLSSIGDPQTEQHAFDIGADDFLRKPMDGTDLARRILSRLQRYRAWSRPVP